MTIIPSQRHLFNIPDHIAYFNCAYYSPLLNESVNRLVQGVYSKSSPWQRFPSHFFEDAETIRKMASEIFGGDTDGYAIIRAASYGFSTAMRIAEPLLKKGDKILVPAEEFPSVVYNARRVCYETGAEIITIPYPEDGNWTTQVLNYIDDEVKILAMSACHWTNGAYVNLEAVGDACRQANCVFMIDATQALGAMPIDIDRIQPDFLIAAAYKWMLCPYGSGLMYVNEKWRNARPLEETWPARENAENFAELVNYNDNYQPGAKRFDAGEKCTPTILPGMVAALEQIQKWGVENIAASISAINESVSSHLLSLGFQLPDAAQRCPHMFGAVLPPAYKGNLVTELKERNIFISQRGNALRFSPHLYNNENDMHNLLNALDDLIR